MSPTLAFIDTWKQPMVKIKYLLQATRESYLLMHVCLGALCKTAGRAKCKSKTEWRCGWVWVMVTFHWWGRWDWSVTRARREPCYSYSVFLQKDCSTLDLLTPIVLQHKGGQPVLCILPINYHAGQQGLTDWPSCSAGWVSHRALLEKFWLVIVRWWEETAPACEGKMLGPSLLQTKP